MWRFLLQTISSQLSSAVHISQVPDVNSPNRNKDPFESKLNTNTVHSGLEKIVGGRDDEETIDNQVVATSQRNVVLKRSDGKKLFPFRIQTRSTRSLCNRRSELNRISFAREPAGLNMVVVQGGDVGIIQMQWSKFALKLEGISMLFHIAHRAAQV